MNQSETAKRNLMIMWFANFFVAGSMTMVLPFISLYIETFGNFTQKYVQHWSGLTFGVTFVSAFLFSPIWGKIGDRYGQEKNSDFLRPRDGAFHFLNGLCTIRLAIIAPSFFYGIFFWLYPDVTSIHFNPNTERNSWTGPWYIANRQYYRFIIWTNARGDFSRFPWLFNHF